MDTAPKAWLEISIVIPGRLVGPSPEPMNTVFSALFGAPKRHFSPARLHRLRVAKNAGGPPLIVLLMFSSKPQCSVLRAGIAAPLHIEDAPAR
jgi:hypothetical protein